MPCNKCDHKFIKYSDPRFTTGMYMKKKQAIEMKNMNCYECELKFIKHGGSSSTNRMNMK